VLASLMFMAIVIPVAVEALHIANKVGVVADRKATAARIADKVLNEAIITTQWKNSNQGGTVKDGPQDYQWTVRATAWDRDVLQVVTAEVTFSVQGQDYAVRLSTLADPSTTTTQ